MVPYQWPWTDRYGQRMSFGAWLKSRKFSIGYVVVIWAIVGILDFGSTRDCESTWQLAFQCDQAIWMAELYSAPLQFFMSLITAPYFHNGWDHILFVVVFGFMLPIQSFEVQHGSLAAFGIFTLSYIFVTTGLGFFFNIGLDLYPDNHFFQFAFERNWMGGSIGFFAAIGGLSFFSPKPWFLMTLVVGFELFINQLVINIDPHISLAHITAASSGWLMCLAWTKFDPAAARRKAELSK